MSQFDDFSLIFRRRADAVAFIKGSLKYRDIQGRVLFYTVREGVIVRAEITGLPKGARPCRNPIFAFHIHSGCNCTGSISDPFANAGTHYNPNNCPHPYHAGDLPPLFGADGDAYSVFLTDRFNLGEIIGKAVVIHSSADDFTTQPAGNSGEKIACGIITLTAR